MSKADPKIVEAAMRQDEAELAAETEKLRVDLQVAKLSKQLRAAEAAGDDATAEALRRDRRTLAAKRRAL